MEVFDRRAVRRHRDRAARTVGSVADVLRDAAERLLDRLDDTTRRFTQALDVGGRGVVAPLLRARGIEVVSCDLSPAMAALNGGLAVAADEEFLPFAPAQLRSGGGEPVAALGERPARRADPVAPRAASGGLLLASLPALGTLAELRQALTEAEAALTGGAAPRVSPFAELRDCAGAAAARRASRCRWRTWRNCGCSTPIRSRCCAICARRGRRTRCASATAACRRGRCSRRRWRRCRSRTAACAVTLRLAMMTGWA